MKPLLSFIFPLLSSAMLFAVEPDEILDDPALEARARAISKNTRCVTCQNEPIDSSNAEIARDLRIYIRERILEGRSDAEIYADLQDLYGPFILFKPPMTAETALLWIGPLGIFLAGGFGVFITLSRRRNLRRLGKLSTQEVAALEKIMGEEKE